MIIPDCETQCHIETCFVTWYYYIEILTKDEVLYKGAFNMKLLYRVTWAIKYLKWLTATIRPQMLHRIIQYSTLLVSKSSKNIYL